MKLRLFVIGGVFVGLLLFGKYLFSLQSRFATLTIAHGNQSVALRVELAQTPEEITRGLSGRNTLVGFDGMLFLLPFRGQTAFWMKDMRFPLDFIWIDDGIIVDLTENVPVPPPLVTYTPKVPVTQVLEVPAGFVRQRNISLGDRVEWQ